MAVFSSRQFNQDTAAAKKAAGQGPVIITDRGQPAFVLMTYADFQFIRSTSASVADLLAMPEGSDLSIDLPTARSSGRDVDLA